MRFTTIDVDCIFELNTNKACHFQTAYEFRSSVLRCDGFPNLLKRPSSRNPLRSWNSSQWVPARRRCGTCSVVMIIILHGLLSFIPNYHIKCGFFKTSFQTFVLIVIIEFILSHKFPVQLSPPTSAENYSTQKFIQKQRQITSCVL